MTRAVPLAAALALALGGGCRSDAPLEPTRREPPGPLTRLDDWPVPGNVPAFARKELGSGFAWDTLDLDGDGLLDLAVTWSGGLAEPPGLTAANPHWWLFRGTGRGFGAGVRWPVPDKGGYGVTGFATADFDTHAADGPSERWRTADLDGDRRPDLVVTGAGPVGDASVLGGTAAPHWRVHRNRGDGFAHDGEDWPLDAAAATVARGLVDVGVLTPGDGPRGKLLDLDGDGRADLVATTDNEGVAMGPGDRKVPGLDEGEPRWSFLRNTGAGFAAPAAWPVPDLNRGRPELPLGGLHATAWDNIADGGIAWTLADLDGDGRPDLVVTSAPGVREAPGLAAGDPHWEVYRNTGSGFAPEPMRWPVPPLLSLEGATGPFAFAGPMEWRWALLDFDGDGRADLLSTATPDHAVAGFPDAPTWTLHRNRGDGFDLAGTPIGLPDGGLDSGGFVGAACDQGSDSQTEAVHAWRTTDVDGDGRADLLWILARDPEAPSLADQLLGLPDAPHWLVSFQR